MHIHSFSTRLLALSGDALTTPSDTIDSYWSALAAGADGLALTVHLTADRIPICLAQAGLSVTTGDPGTIDQITMADLLQLDAGSRFRSTVLDGSNRPTGEYGNDFPWRATSDTQRKLTHPTLQDTLRLFGRRCELLLLLPERLSFEEIAIVWKTVDAAGLSRRVTVGGTAQQLSWIPAQTPRALITMSPLRAISDALSLKAQFIVAPFSTAFTGTSAPDPQLMTALEDANLDILLRLDANTPSPPPESTDFLRASTRIAGLLAPGALATAQVLNPPALLIEDDFADTRINRDIWTAGYSHANQDTTIYQQGGLHIAIQAGGSYSGGAVVCRLPVHGRFDAQVRFHVENPSQGTTFEMAAISVDPGAFHITNHDLDSRTVNLTFDVHGAPPYASSECDEDNGFRCGWNNGFSLTRIDPNWNASSANMYNKYGRNVGEPSSAAKEGTLRLVRNGSVFASYYRDSCNSGWVNSGAMLVHNLAEDVFIRLAAKHWTKANPQPPANHVVFHDFRLYQN